MGSRLPFIITEGRFSTLNNRDGALIFSAGDLAVGGALDASHRATGQAGTLNNTSATIEAVGDLRIDSSQLNNSRSSFATRQVVTSSTPVNVVLWDRGGDGNYKLTKTTNIQVSETRVTTDSGAGKILAGRDLYLTGAVNNDKSEILAGRNILLDLAGYTATSLQGQTQKSETGYTTLYYRKKCKWYEFCSYKNHRSTNSPYNDGPYTLATFDVAVARMTANQAITGTATQIGNLSVGAVNQGAAGANGLTAAVGAGSSVGRITRVNAPATGSGPAAVVATVNAPGALPSNSLFRTQPEAGKPLVETDPSFASYRQWLSSDTMLKALALDPATTQKRLGDGFYEQRLITEQVAQLTGRRFLVGYANEEAQYLALMNAGVTIARQWNLIPGVALSAEQMAQLTTDMVWLVEKEVTLADGSTQKVLTPQLYARVQPGDLDASGGLLAANSIDLDVGGDLTNMGTLAGRQLVSLTADNIRNLAGRISGEQVALAARSDLDNIGGSIAADNALLARAGRNLTVASVSESHSGGSAHASRQSTAIARLASLHVKNPGGTLQLEAGGDIALLAAHLLNTAPTAAGPASRTTLVAGQDIKLATLTESSASGLMLDGNNYRRQSETHETGSVIESRGDIRLQAGQSVSARAATVTSNEGALAVTAGKDITIEAGEASQRREAASRTTKRGFLSSKTTTTRDSSSDTTAVASTFSGDSTTLIADRDIAIKGSNVVATKDTTLIAGRDLSIAAAAESHSETHYSKTKQSGVFSSGGVGFTIGSKQNSTDQQTDATLAAKSTVGSTDGNVLLLAGETYKQVGSDVIAAKGDIDISAKTVDIKEARETSRTVTETKSKQSGFTVAFTNPVISAVQTAQQMSEAAKDTKDGRMKVLAAASTGLAGYNAYSALEAGQGITTPDGKTNQVLSGKTNPDGSAEYRDATAADKMGGVGINLSIGGSKSSSKSTQSSDTAAVSNLTAGRDLTITATGAGEQSDISLQGAKASAARNLTLSAEDEIRLLAAKNVSDQHSTNNNSSASLGVGFMVGGAQNGFTIQAGVSGGKGKADGQDVSHSNTQLTAGDTLTLKSGGDTTLKGAVAKGERVKADIKGDLAIESLQDTSTYDSKQKSLGVSVSLCTPPLCVGAPSTGSISASASKVQSDYASVVEQSGLRAGDKGFDVKVGGDTDLKGGAITSTDKAVQENRNRFETGGELTLSDIQNKAEYKAKSVSVNVGTSFSAAGALTPGGTSAGFGKDGGKAESMTLAAISGVAGNKEARTGDKETGIAKIFDQAKVQKEINAQTKITQTFGQLAPKAAADFAKTQADDLKKQGKEEEAKKWEDGGAYRVALHTAIGGLAGGAQGALGAGATAAAAPLLNELQDNIAKGLKAAGASDGVAKLAGQLVSGATAAGIGATAGGSAGAAMGFNVDANNRQLHPSEEKWLKEKAKEFAKKEGISEKTALERLTQQALKEVDYLWRAQLADGDDASAKTFLATAQQTFANDLGEQQKLFTAQGQQLFRPEMFANTADVAFYKQFAQSGISRSLGEGLAKELKDSGVDLKNSAAELAKLAKDNPGVVLSGLWNAVKGLPQSVVDGFKETGTAIGEGAAVGLNQDLTEKLNALYGTDVAGAQKALLAIRVTAAVTGAGGVAKAGTHMSEVTAKAIGKKLDEVLDQKATEALLKSGGVYDRAGQPLLDMKQLTDNQKGVMGDLFGANTVKQIVPDGEKLARIPGVGETGIDDLYRVKRPDVDYVVIEYKFVGDNTTKGSWRLDQSPADGPQGSESWTLGSGRLQKAVGDEKAIAIENAVKTGRTETWVVTTRANGSTEIEVLNALGKPKPIDTSRILTSGMNLSGVKP